MLHGDVLTATADGVIVRETALHTIGIFDKSACWGVWIPDLNPNSTDPNHAHLIVSPFHPRSWPYLVRVRLRLSAREGALSAASNVLRTNSFSILYAECMRSGFTHSSWNVIAEYGGPELDALREAKNQIDRRYKRVRTARTAQDECRKWATQLAAVMFPTVRRLQQLFEDADTVQRETEGRGFLSEKIRQGKQLLYTEDVAFGLAKQQDTSLTDDVLEELARRHRPPAIQVEWLHRMAEYGTYGGGENVPLPFVYESRRRLLRLKSESGFGGPLTKTEIPAIAVGSFNTSGRYLRLNPMVTQRREDRATQVTIQYSVRSGDHAARPSSKGLLNELYQVLVSANAVVLYHTNKTVLDLEDLERGALVFVVLIDPSRRSELAARLTAIILPHELGYVHLEDVAVQPLSTWKLFISTRLSASRKDLVSIIDRAARRYGFEPRVVDTLLDDSTTSVLEELRNCDAFLQVFCESDGENANKTGFAWLHTEFGMALRQGLKCARIVDTAVHKMPWWKKELPVAGDQKIESFMSTWDPQRIEAKFNEMVDQLATAVTDSHRLGR